MAEMRYLVRGGDRQDYPADLQTLQAWTVAGHLQSNQYVYDTTDRRWVLASDITELHPLFAAQPASRLHATQVGSGLQTSRASFAVIAVLLAITIAIVIASSTKDRTDATSSSVSPPATVTSSTEPQPAHASTRTAKLDELVRGLAPLFDGYTIVGPVSVQMKLNAVAWNGMSHDQQQQLGDMLASKQIVRDIGCTLHLYVYETEVGTIGPGWSGDWRFRRN